MTEHPFFRLHAYRHAAALADAIFRLTRGWPAYERAVMGFQLARAADSIAANIAEATGRMHTPDRRRFLHIARGSLCETESWIARAKARGLLGDELDDELGQAGRALNGLIKRPGNPSSS
jgi:four helix bundle protein